MTDRELLELAAKAAGIGLRADRGSGRGIAVRYMIGGKPFDTRWSPLTDDGTALQLAMALAIDIYHGTGDGPEIWAGYWIKNSACQKHACVPVGKNINAAARMAIVRAAAEIGKAMT